MGLGHEALRDGVSRKVLFPVVMGIFIIILFDNMSIDFQPNCKKSHQCQK